MKTKEEVGNAIIAHNLKYKKMHNNIGEFIGFCMTENELVDFANSFYEQGIKEKKLIMDNYEEKYKKTFEEAKKSYLNIKEELDSIKDKSSSDALALSNCIDVLVYLFPELIESEDESIKKELIKYLQESPLHYKAPMYKGATYTPEEAVEWIIKQAEHAKFRESIQIGDKVTRNQDGVLVNLSQLQRTAKPTEQEDICDTCEHPMLNCQNFPCDRKQGEQKPANNKSVIDIEIPFGAKDSELVEETISIPDGCYAVIEDDKVIIRREKKPAEWSEEDVSKLENAISYIENSRFVSSSYPYSREVIVDWLKSLKDRDTWKPSEEQMEALNNASMLADNDEESVLLATLYNDLKKLINYES